MPSCSQACSVPVRPMPHITSSRISSTPWRSQMSRMRLKIVGHRRHRAGGRADHGLGDEGHHGVRAELEDLVLQRLRGAPAVVLLALAGSWKR